MEKPSEIETDLIVGSLLNAEAPRVNIRMEDARGRTIDEVAKQITVDPEGFPIERSSIVLGNVEAIVLDKLPGQDIIRQVIVVHDGRLYKLTFVAAEARAHEIHTQFEALYTTAIDSFRFLH